MADDGENATRIEQVRESYREFEALLAPLSEEQLTTPNVNGEWSVKDNLAHLTAWHGYLLDQLTALRDGGAPPEWMPSLSTEDEINERIYQQNKDRPLAEAQAEFRASFERVLAAIEALSAEQLNAPFPWSTSGNPVWGLIAGNTLGHYEEHGNIIRGWLEQN